MNLRGVMPACVTPFTVDGEIDGVSLARLFAKFAADGCSGVVVAGTNGEGPSLSAVEKRDLIRMCVALSGDMECILGISTPSLPEAIWLAQQAGKCGASGVLVMAPGYFRSAFESGVTDWLLSVAEASPVPMIAYNFPRYTGFTFTETVIRALSDHGNIGGFKDSSGEIENLAMFKRAANGRSLMVGDETILREAIAAGWHGTISGAANLVSEWLVEVVGDGAIDDTKLEVLRPVIEEIRRGPQPAVNKSVLHSWGLLGCPNVRLPLENADGGPVLQKISSFLG